MTLKYLITGATGGLGSQVLAYLAAHIPSSEYAAASSSEASRSRFEKDGIAFRVANFDDPATLDTAFKDVENLFFVSTNTFDNARRTIQHRNVVAAAKRAGIKHVRAPSVLIMKRRVILVFRKVCKLTLTFTDMVHFSCVRRSTLGLEGRCSASSS